MAVIFGHFIPFKHGEFQVVGGAGVFQVAKSVADSKTVANASRNKFFKRRFGGGGQIESFLAVLPAGGKGIKAGFEGQGGKQGGGVDFMETAVEEKAANKLDGMFFDELAVELRLHFSLRDSLCVVLFLHHRQYFLSLSFSGWLILLRSVR